MSVQQTKLNVYQQRAHATRAARQAAGRYATPSQRFALKKYLADGIDALKPSEMELLATHPALSQTQRNRFAALAEAVR